MRDLRKYHLELAHRFQIENPQWSISVNTMPLGNYISIFICGFDKNNELYGKSSLDNSQEDFTTRLEYLVKHGYNPMKGVY